MDHTNPDALDPVVWRRCSSCKKSINYGALYWVCSVSTCNRKLKGLVFCDVSCWDAHVPGMNHKESWAEERKAPKRDEWERTLRGEDKAPRKRAPKEEAKAVEAPKPSGPPKVLVRRGGGQS